MKQIDIARQYKKQQVESANPAQLVVLLYDGAIDYLNKAEETLKETGAERIEKFHNHLIAAQNIITELTVSLDIKRGGDIASNLLRLYEYMNHRLIDSNINKDEQPLQEVKQLLNTLREAWVTIQSDEAARERPKPVKGFNIQG